MYPHLLRIIPPRYWNCPDFIPVKVGCCPQSDAPKTCDSSNSIWSPIAMWSNTSKCAGSNPRIRPLKFWPLSVEISSTSTFCSFKLRVAFEQSLIVLSFTGCPAGESQTKKILSPAGLTVNPFAFALIICFLPCTQRCRGSPAGAGSGRASGTNQRRPAAAPFGRRAASPERKANRRAVFSRVRLSALLERLPL